MEPAKTQSPKPPLRPTMYRQKGKTPLLRPAKAVAYVRPAKAVDVDDPEQDAVATVAETPAEPAAKPAGKAGGARATAKG